MELTGKCKEDFYEWLLTDCEFVLEHEYLSMDRFNLFPHLTHSMQYGVYVDFFDSVGIYVSVSKYEDSLYESYVQYNDYQSSIREWEETLNEARTEAIKEVNEIYNQNK